MPRRPAPEPLSPRALARLRSSPRAFVPTALDLSGRRVAGAGDRNDRQRPDERGQPEPPSHEPHPWAADAERHPPEHALGEDEAGGERGRAAGGRHSRVPHPRGWVRLPAAFVGARWQPGRGALVGVLLVVVLAAAVFGLRVLWAQSAGGGTVLAPGGGSRAGPTGVTAGAVPVGASPPAPKPTGSAAGEGGAPVLGSTTAPAASGAAGVVVVHVVGHVRRPGVRQLPVGSRVADAVEAAGGATGKADLSLLNLARVLVDGEQVRVPAHGDPPEVGGGGTGGGGAAGGGSSGGGTTGGSGAKVPLNTADAAALDTLPGVGPVLAQRIIDWRAEHGRFTSVDELGEVSGIGDKLLAQLSPLVTL